MRLPSKLGGGSCTTTAQHVAQVLLVWCCYQPACDFALSLTPAFGGSMPVNGPVEVAMKSCPRCASGLKPNSRFCGKCGFRHSEVAPHPPAAPILTKSASPEQSASVLPDAEPAAGPPVKLRIFFKPNWLLADCDIQVFSKGQQLGSGSVNGGVDIRIAGPVGHHDLELRYGPRVTHHALHVPMPGWYQAELKYKPMSGSFSMEVHRVG